MAHASESILANHELACVNMRSLDVLPGLRVVSTVGPDKIQGNDGC